MQKLAILATAMMWCVIGVSSVAPTGRYKAIVDKMRLLEQTYPDLVSVYSIGENDDNVEILALRISTTPKTVDPAKIGHLIVSTHHGNELAAPLWTMAFVDDLLQRYTSAELWRGNISEIEWSIIPVLNISGYNRNERYEHNYDPNRDYPGICITDPGGQLKSIRLLMDYMKTRIFSGSLTVHGYVGSLTYPWGVDAHDVHTADHNMFASVTAKAAKENGYRHGTSTDIVYAADGTYEDYAYWKHGMWSLLLELESGSETDIADTVRAMRVYFDQLNGSPSTQHEFTSVCRNRGVPSFRAE